MNKKVFRALITTLYLIILAADCILILIRQADYRLYTKPLLLPVLYILLAGQASEGSHKRSKLFITFAIFLSFGGDLALLYDSDANNFVLGLLSFLFAHIAYALFFLRLKKFAVKRLPVIIGLSVVIISYMFLLIAYLWPGITDQGYNFPVVLYAISLAFMLLTALYTGTGTRILKVAYQNFIPGAILFVISDSVLAVDKFGVIIGDSTYHLYLHMFYHVVIIVTYGFSQLLLVGGAIRIIRR